MVVIGVHGASYRRRLPRADRKSFRPRPSGRPAVPAAPEGFDPLVDNAKNKPPVIALREIAADKVRFDKDVKEVMSSTPSELKAMYGEPSVTKPTRKARAVPRASSEHRAPRRADRPNIRGRDGPSLARR